MENRPVEAVDRRLEDLQVGDQAVFRTVITEQSIAAFAALSGDFNPLHLEQAYAETVGFAKPIAHGMLLGAFVSRLVGMHLPGRRSLWLSASFDFVEPVYPGDEIEVAGEIASTHLAVSTLVVRVLVTVLPARIAVRGKAVVKILE